MGLRGYILLCALLIVQLKCFGQEIEYTGKIIDSVTKEPLSYVNIILKGKRIGTFSDEMGSFKIPCKLKDSLTLSHIGYTSISVVIVSDQGLIKLKPQSKVINEVVITSSRKLRKETLGLLDQKADIFMGGVFQYAVFIENTSQRIGLVRTLYFKLGHAFNREKTDKLPAKIRARIYERESSTGAPGRDILRNELIFTIQPNQKNLKIDVSNENVPFLADGIFIGIDVLGYIDDSGTLVHYHVNDAKKHLHIPVSTRFASPLTYMNPDGQEWRIHKSFDPKTGRREITNACFGAEVEF